MPDIDIDFADRTKALEIIKHVRASRLDHDKLVPHNTGIYVQPVPYDPVTNLSGIEYKSAENRGYMKLDFLNVGIYAAVCDEAHLVELMNTEPLWELLLEDDFTDQLFHVNGHGSILRKMKPRSIEELAAVLAIIRPAKRHLIGKDWTTVMLEVWTKPEGDEYFFKKSHAYSYACVVMVHMNIICESYN